LIFIGAAASAQTAAAETDFALAGDEPNYVDLGAGAFNILSTRATRYARATPYTGEGVIEFRYGSKLFGLGPAMGLLADGQGGVYGYAGVYADFVFGHFVVRPLAALGGYSSGNSVDLGGAFEFRLSADFAYAFDDQSRLGVRFGHISNSGLHRINPSENEALLSYSIPVRTPF
jgi:hypothetical protein